MISVFEACGKNRAKMAEILEKLENFIRRKCGNPENYLAFRAVFMLIKMVLMAGFAHIVHEKQ